MLSWNHHSECKRVSIVSSFEVIALTHTMCVFCLFAVVVVFVFDAMCSRCFCCCCCLCVDSISWCISIVWSLHRLEFVAFYVCYTFWLLLWLSVSPPHTQHILSVSEMKRPQCNTSQTKWFERRSSTTEKETDQLRYSGWNGREEDEGNWAAKLKFGCTDVSNAVSIAYEQVIFNIAIDVCMHTCFKDKSVRSFFCWSYVLFYFMSFFRRLLSFNRIKLSLFWKKTKSTERTESNALRSQINT